MTKVFISQPMNGKTDVEIKIERVIATRIINDMIDDEVEIIDSFIENAPENATPLWYLGESIKMMADADYIYLCNGAIDYGYRGCNCEAYVAGRYGIPVIYAPHISEQDS